MCNCGSFFILSCGSVVVSSLFIIAFIVCAVLCLAIAFNAVLCALLVSLAALLLWYSCCSVAVSVLGCGGSVCGL